ncbi:putative RNA-directed DNA polymerase [Tanacetum coccineum]
MSITSISYYTSVRYTESEASAVKTQVRGNVLCKTVRLSYLASTWTKCINSLGLVWLEKDIIRADDKDTKQVAWKDRHWKEQDGIHVITVQYYANQELTGWCIGRKDEGVKMYKELHVTGVPSSHYLRGRKRKNGERVKNNEQASFASVKRRLHQLQKRNMTGSLFSGDVDSKHVGSNAGLCFLLATVWVKLNFPFAIPVTNREYGIKGFPTIKVFVPGKPPVDYQRAREAKPIAEFALKKAETTKDLNEWKAALEEALPDAPTASQTVGLSQRPYRGGVAVYQLPNHFECDSCVRLLSIYLMVRFSLERNNQEHQFLHTTLSYEDFGTNWRWFCLSHIVHVPAASVASKRRWRIFEKRKDSMSSSWVLTASLFSSRRNIDSENDWVIDSGSTKHITHNVEILENKVSCSNEDPVVIPNGDSYPLREKGECTLTGSAKIKGVLYIPKFTCNLLSVSRLCEDPQSAIKFFPNLCVMQKFHTRNLIGTSECRSGLYRMGMFGTEKKAWMTTTNVWHSRLGHASGDKLSQIDFLKNVTFNKLCDSCSRAKHTRLPFQYSVIKTSDYFELMHCDV